MFIYFLKERDGVSRGGTERQGDTESEAGSRLPAVSTEPHAGLELTNHEIMTWAEVSCLTKWATQASRRFGFSTQLLLILLGFNSPALLEYHLKCHFWGVPGWLSWLSVRLQLRSWSHGSWVWAPHWALYCQCRTCLGFSFYVSLPLPCSLSLSQK